MPNRLTTHAVTIEPAPAARRAEALALLRINQSRIRRMLTAEGHGSLDMRGLFLARRAEHLVGAAWGQTVPGRIAFCWPPCLAPREPESTAIQLQEAVDKHVDAQGVSMAQAVVSIRAVIDAARLSRAGYHHLADLDYLVALRECFPQRQPPSDLEFRPVIAADQSRLAALIERTYQGSLDCPKLDRMRRIEDVLNGYRHTGQYRPDWWLFARHAGQDVGCVLLADHPAHDQSELMYVGVVPQWRGRGWGVQITRFAQWLVGQARRERMVLAVDSLNWPAENIYALTGFDRWDRRRVFLRSVAASA